MASWFGRMKRLAAMTPLLPGLRLGLGATAASSMLPNTFIFEPRPAYCVVGAFPQGELEQHQQHCYKGACQCRAFPTFYDKWAKKLTIRSGEVSQTDSDSWLWYKINGAGNLQWTCLACETALGGVQSNNNHHRLNVETPTEEERTILKISNIKAHESSLSHQRAIVRCAPDLAVEPEREGDHFILPSHECFQDALRQFHAGATPGGDGYILSNGVRLGKHKLRCVLWCLSEALRVQRHQEILACSCLALARDERHGRMHVRFFGCTEETLEPVRGYLGQSKRHSPSSIGLRKATHQVFSIVEYVVPCFVLYIYLCDKGWSGDSVATCVCSQRYLGKKHV